MATQYACERVIDADDLACDCDIPADISLVNQVLDAASDILQVLTGVQIGRCSATYRPCYTGDACYPGSCCGCCGLLGIHLWGVNPTVTAVKIDGATVPTSEYTIITNTYGVKVLERYNASTGRSVWWPRTQKLVLPSTAADTFEITLTTGLAINIPMQMAAAEIACEMFKGLAGEDNILDGAVSATMFGLSVNYTRFSDPTDQATMNLAGLGYVRRFVSVADVGKTAQILAPELDDNWDIYQRAA